MGINLTSKEPVPLWQRLVIGRNPKRTMIRAGILVILAFITFRYILLPVRITGISMEPTYHNGKVNLINRLAYRWTPPKRGDIVAVRTSGPHIMYLKRIIGLPGETIAISKGIVFINGKALEEPYILNREPWEQSERRLEPDKYLVIGDNRRMPQEMHKYGFASADHIVGKVLW